MGRRAPGCQALLASLDGQCSRTDPSSLCALSSKKHAPDLSKNYQIQKVQIKKNFGRVLVLYSVPSCNLTASTTNINHQRSSTIINRHQPQSTSMNQPLFLQCLRHHLPFHGCKKGTISAWTAANCVETSDFTAATISVTCSREALFFHGDLA